VTGVETDTPRHRHAPATEAWYGVLMAGPDDGECQCTCGAVLLRAKRADGSWGDWWVSH
jgi:hypothetical protein